VAKVSLVRGRGRCSKSHSLLFEALQDVGCGHDRTLCRRILVLMGLDNKAIEACLTYFPLQGGGCDCEVDLNVEMTEPRPLVDFSCADFAADYDEYYVVQNDIWKVYSVGKGMLRIGCLEKRMGRQLSRHDFIDVALNEIDPETQSLRLQDRLSINYEARRSTDDKRETSYARCGCRNKQCAETSVCVTGFLRASANC
jgi:Protein of unknown function (DUF2695)